MPATADNLKDLHELHQRAKALRDRLSSGPKTLAARQATLAARTSQVEQERKALQDAKVQLKKHEHDLQGVEKKIDDSTTKLNLVKKNDEYKALQNQIAHETAAKSKVEEEILVNLEDVETRTAAFLKLEAEVKRFSGEISTLQQQIDSEAAAQKAQLAELETAIVQAEGVIPEEHRVQYRRIAARYGADTLAACDEGSCRGCFSMVTSQMMNELINGNNLTFCMSCGRLLYLPEKVEVTTRRTGGR